MDEFTPPSERRRLGEQWAALLTSGAALLEVRGGTASMKPCTSHRTDEV